LSVIQRNKDKEESAWGLDGWSGGVECDSCCCLREQRQWADSLFLCAAQNLGREILGLSLSEMTPHPKTPENTAAGGKILFMLVIKVELRAKKNRHIMLCDSCMRFPGEIKTSCISTELTQNQL